MKYSNLVDMEAIIRLSRPLSIANQTEGLFFQQSILFLIRERIP
jgi:hypothetical protein